MSVPKTLIIITILAAVLRLAFLDRYPVHMSVDEVAIGYDAFSLLFSGRDHYQTLFPLTFISLGDYKPPLYHYLTVLPVRIWGLNEFSVRFTSAFFGILAIPLVYFLSRTLTSSKTPSLPLYYFVFLPGICAFPAAPMKPIWP